MSKIKFESELWEKGYQYIAGLDEAGRGPLAGPIIISAVILDKDHFISLLKQTNPNTNTFKIESNQTNNDISYAEMLKTYSFIDDSKKLTKKRRELLESFIKLNSICYSIVEIPCQEIDTFGIAKANSVGFYRAIKNLTTTPEHILTDHFLVPNIAVDRQTNVTRGDSLSVTIAAASILAKTYRDEIMTKYHETYPEYGFDKHKGYGTKLHMKMIEKYGPCEIHRKSFYPVSKYFDGKH
ncbi:ribonuclease HII [candidate division WWE3 bacterium]|nr:ribonuclease HII [candidate division WWE3 bacterium]